MISSLRGQALGASILTLAAVSLGATAANAQVLISQLYGGGGSTVAATTYNFDYVELYNNSTTAADLTGESIQYASATGAVSSTFAFVSGAMIAPKSYYLIEAGQKGAAGGAASPAADAKTLTTSFSISNSGGKVFLVSNTTAATFGTGSNNSTTLSSNVLDFIGFGTATAYNGSGLRPRQRTPRRPWYALWLAMSTRILATTARTSLTSPSACTTAWEQSSRLRQQLRNRLPSL